MSEIDITKGITALKSMAENLCSTIDYCNANNLDEILPFIEEMQKGCSILTDIFAKSFTNLVIEKERLEDDGK